MNLTDIIQYYQAHFPNSYKRISTRITQATDPEEKARIYIAFSTLFCFSSGLIYDLLVYAFSTTIILFTANLLSLVIYAIATSLYIWRKLPISTLLTALLIVVQANVSISILYNYNIVVEYNKFIVSYDLFISFLICILASLTLRKSQVYILSSMPLIALTTVLAIYSPGELIRNFPSFCLAYIAPPVLLTHIRIILWNTFRKKDQLISEKESLCRLMGMNEQQWDLLIDIVQKPHAPRKQTEELFKQMQEAIGNRLVIRAERLLASEQLIGKINEKYKFSLTANEVRLCCLILEDKSINEISNILYINESSVRANRSRIRKKMGLKREMNLKAQLIMLIGEAKKTG